MCIELSLETQAISGVKDAQEERYSKGKGICQDRPTFRRKVNDFGPSHSLSEMVDRVIDHCETHLLFDGLPAQVREHHPGQYARFESFTVQAQKTAQEGIS